MRRIISSLIIVVLFCLPAFAKNAVVAKVNGTVFTQKDLDAELDRLIPQITFHRSVPPEKRKYYYGKALEELINRELEYKDALAKGIKPDEKDVETQMKNIRNRFTSEEQYKKALEKQGLTEKKLKAMVEREMLIRSITEQTVTEPARMSEPELKKYYETNISKFKQPESVRLRLISTKDEKKARDIVAKLKDGDDFADLAYNFSEDEYRLKGGDLGYIHKGRMIPEIEKVAFKLNVGEVSEPIKAGDTWYIIKVEDKKPERQLSFEEIKGKLRKDLESERARELREKWIKALRAKAKIEVLLKTEK